MICENCKVEVSSNSNFCHICGDVVIQNKNRKYSHNVITNSGNLNYGENIHVNSTNYYLSNDSELIYFKKVDQSILKSPKKLTNWSITIGTLSFIGSIASIGSTMGLNLPTVIIPYWIKFTLWIITFFCFSIVFIAIELRVNKTSRIPTGKGNFIYLELSNNNEIVITNNIIANCPICLGTIYVRRLKENNESHYFGVCTHNPQHLYTFNSESMTGSRLYI